MLVVFRSSYLELHDWRQSTLIDIITSILWAILLKVIKVNYAIWSILRSDPKTETIEFASVA